MKSNFPLEALVPSFNTPLRFKSRSTSLINLSKIFIFYVPGTVLEVTHPKVNKIRHCPCPHSNYSLIADISLTQRMTQIMYISMIITAPKELLKVN